MNPWFKRHYQRFYITGIAALVLLAACSSGGESGTGLQQGQTTVGEISGFGSIYVNGTKFNTDQATVKIDGINDDETNLAVGMVVTVKGSVSSDGTTGTAREVIAKSEVEGLVFENNYVSSGTINVMGQTVRISNDTQFKSQVNNISTIDQLVALSTVVEVNGYSDGSGTIYATYVKAVESGSASEIKLHGTVNNLSGDAVNGSFTIGDTSLLINYDASTTFEGMAIDDLVNGLYVSVESSNYSGGDVQALEIEREDINNEGEGSELEVEGIVTDSSQVAAGTGAFELNGRVVHYDTATVFEGGIATDIQIDMKLEVDGTVQPDHSILANEIDFREESDTEIEGTVQEINGTSLVIDDGINDPVTVVVNELTKYEDETDETNRTFNFSDIMRNMMIEAKYYVDPDGINVATSIAKTM
jgi:hypothetical protein